MLKKYKKWCMSLPYFLCLNMHKYYAKKTWGSGIPNDAPFLKLSQKDLPHRYKIPTYFYHTIWLEFLNPRAPNFISTILGDVLNLIMRGVVFNITLARPTLCGVLGLPDTSCPVGALRMVWQRSGNICWPD